MLLSSASKLARCLVVTFPLFLAIANGTPDSTGAAPNPTVTVSSGVVIGTAKIPANHEPTDTSVANVFLGIPYVQSPPERFSPPQPPKNWSTPLAANANKPACIQMFGGSLVPPVDGVWVGLLMYVYRVS